MSLQGSALFSKDPFSGQREPFDLCFVGFNRVDYADVKGKKKKKKNTQAMLRGCTVKQCFSASGSLENASPLGLRTDQKARASGSFKAPQLILTGT